MIRPPARVGDPVSAIDTPALVIDLDAFERNLDALAGFAAASGMRLRPHAKTHKSADVALAQIARGAVGQCCQKVSEAEVLVDGGVIDVLVSNEVVGEAKLARLAALATRASISVCADDIAQVAAYGAAARAADSNTYAIPDLLAGVFDAQDSTAAKKKAAAAAGTSASITIPGAGGGTVTAT